MSLIGKYDDIRIVTSSDENANEAIEQTVKKKSLGERIPGLGLICAALGVLCGSCQMIVVKYLKDVHSIELFVFR